MRTMLFLICLGIIFLSPSTLKAQIVNQVSQVQGIKLQSSIKASNGRINVVYENATNAGSTNNVFYQSSLDGGITYSLPVMVSPANALALSPDVAIAPNGNIYVVWFGTGGTLPFSIFVARSTDNGVSFSTSQVVSSNASLSGNPRININRNGLVYVSYFDGALGRIFVNSFSDASFPISIGKPVRVSGPGRVAKELIN